MAFEVRIMESEGGAAPIIARFTDGEWRNLAALAHECGFDTASEYEWRVFPPFGDTRELGARLAQQLYIGVGVILNQDVLPFATTWDSDDGHLHFRWIKPSEYGSDRVPADQSEPGEGSDFRVKPATLIRLRENLLLGPVRVTHATESS